MVKKLNQLGVQVTVACKRLGISRSTYYHHSKDKDKILRKTILDIAYQHPSLGYRRITAISRRQGIKVNHKRVYRSTEN